MTNIYLELELSLDPPITDETALKAEIEKKIGSWNKMINTDPKYKVRVSKAKEYLARGLSNLQNQADKAHSERLQALRNDIKKAGRVGGINELKLKKIKSRHGTFFRKETIEQECSGAMSAAAPQLPKFVPPSCPNSFVSTKKIAFKEMADIAEDLKLIDGTPIDLYELLKASPTDTIEKLSALAKELSAKAIKMPKTNSQADPLNRLSGKCINFFKDEQNKKNYDIALKRFPFDNLCEDEFSLYIDKESGIPWDVYQDSIRETVQLGFAQDEAEWLVYEYYCVVNRCPDPIPELEKSPFVMSSPEGGKTEKPLFTLQQTYATMSQRASETAKKAGHFFSRLGKEAKNFYDKAQQQKSDALPVPVQQKQSDTPTPDRLQKTIDGLRNKFSRQKKPSIHYLNGLFEELDTMTVQYQTAPAEMLRNLKSFRAEVAEVLGDFVYAAENFALAQRCYRAILDSMPQHAKATTRFKAIDNVKDNLFQQIKSALATQNYLVCKQGIGELNAKFAADLETEDFIHKIEKQIAEVPISREDIQQLQNENRWYALANILEGTDQPSSVDVLRKAKKRVAEVEKNFPIIRQTLQNGKVEKVQQQLHQVQKFIADHPEYESILKEINESKQHVQSSYKKLKTDIEELIQKGQVVKAENELRQYLVKGQVFSPRLVSYADYCGNGVTRFQNGLRFGLFTIISSLCVLFLFISLYAALGSRENDSNDFTGVEGTIALGAILALGFLITSVVFSFLIRFLYRLTKTPLSPGGFGWFGTIILCLLTSIAGAVIFDPSVIERIVPYGISSNSTDPVFEEKVWTHIFFGIGSWFFFLLMQVFIFSFFYRCMEDENSQPLSSLLVSILIPAGLTTAKWFSVSDGLLLWGTVFTFWSLSTLLAYLYLHHEMDAFSIARMPDYWKRNALLHQYRDIDFGQPLLYTDWYQKAFDLAQQQEAQRQFQEKKSQVIQQRAQQLAQQQIQQQIDQQAQQLAQQKVRQFQQQQLAQQKKQKPAQTIPVPHPKK